MSERILRTFDVTLEGGDGDGRTVSGRLVPYGEIAEVGDRLENGEVRTYREVWEHGAFRGIARAAHRVTITHEHDPMPLGRAVELAEQPDGLYGSFSLVHSSLADHVLELVRAKILHGLSIVAVALSPGKRRGGVVVRTYAHLESVGLTQRPAYAGAEVLAVRSQLEVERPRRNAALDERLERLGLVRG